jgi:alkylresorcinol/alkylpyrone synthase
MKIASVRSAFPPHYYRQEELLEAFRAVWNGRLHNPERLARMHRNVQVGGRFLALPLEEYDRLGSWGEANDAWVGVATEVGAQAVERAVAAAGRRLDEIDALYTVSVTGIATPSIDARIMNHLSLPESLVRVPIFGLGCVAGAAGVARVADYLRAWPERVAVLLSVELCSLTLQRADLSIANLIASGLFGDGAAALVAVGGDRSADGPRVVDAASVFYPETEEVMGWEVTDGGFRVVLSAEVPEMVRCHLRDDVDRFLGRHGMRRADIGSWVAHTGGPRVLEAMEEVLELPEGALDVTWRSLREVGNLSSTSVLLVLEEVLREHRPPPGTPGLMLAMGPGFCSELVLLQW